MNGTDGHVPGRSEAVAAHVPQRHLPALVYRDLPEALPVRALLGPGVIAAGVGLASGEFVLWPFIASQVGLVLLWAATLGIITQFFINMEIERYTLATGETALTGFSRFWRHWGLCFAILVYFANLWPGWITSSATLLTYVIGGGSTVVIAILGLIVIGVVLTVTPVVYQALEKVQFGKVGAVLFFVAVAMGFAITASAWRDLPQAITTIGRLPAELSPALVLGALAFAGAGGGQNLVQSNWIRDKGFGMGLYIPRLVSPLTGQEEAAPGTGYLMRDDAVNRSRWQQWWRAANAEQLISFGFVSFITIVLMSLLSYSTVFGQEGLAQDISFLRVEGEALQARVGEWFGVFFWIIGAFSLFASALGIVDYTSRLAADVLKVHYLRNNAFWSESKLYFALVWGLVVVGTTILMTVTSQPLVLLVISSCVGGFMMFVYSGLLILINRRILPEHARIRGVRLGAMIWSSLFFGFFSVIAIVDQWDNIQQLFDG